MAGDAAVVEPAAAARRGRRRAAFRSGRRRRPRTRCPTTAAATASAATPARSARPARAIRRTRRSAGCSQRRRSSCTIARWCDGSCPRTAAARRRRSSRAEARHRDRPADPVEYRARTFVLAAGYCWSPHLLLLSTSSRFPNGLANSSGHVGRYMAGHAFISAQIELDAEIYPGMNEQHSLISRQFFRCATDKPFVRHDFRIWESGAGTRSAAEERRRAAAARRRAARRLARAGEARRGARADVLRRAPVRRQHADARSGGEESFRRPAAEDRAPARRGDRGARCRRRSATSTTCSRSSREAHNGKILVDERRRLSRSSGRRLPHGHRSGDERLRQLTAARTTTGTSSSSARRRCRPPAAPTARSRSPR